MKWKPQATVSKGAGPTDRDLRVKPDELCALPFLSFHRCVLTTVEEGGGGGGKGGKGEEEEKSPPGEKKTETGSWPAPASARIPASPLL